MARLLERLRDLLKDPTSDAVMAAFNESELKAEEALQRSYRRFLEIVRKVEERGELADFLSIHQRLRTKVHAYARYVRSGHAVPARTAAATALPMPSSPPTAAAQYPGV